MNARRALGAVCTADHCACVAGGELGVALSGGGARGLAQIGVLKVLERARIPVSSCWAPCGVPPGRAAASSGETRCGHRCAACSGKA